MSEAGQRELELGIEQARGLDPVTHATVMTLKCGLTALGLEAPDEATLSDARAALKRAEAFGDNFAVAAALWACGTILLRFDRRSAQTAVEYLERARNIIVKHRVLAVALAPIEADLAVEPARAGGRDAAIETARSLIHRQITQSDSTFITVSTAAFVQLLTDRGRSEDIAEATALVETMEQQVLRIPVAAFHLGVAFCRLVVDSAKGNNTTAVAKYHEVVERTGARGEFLPLHPELAAACRPTLRARTGPECDETGHGRGLRWPPADPRGPPLRCIRRSGPSRSSHPPIRGCRNRLRRGAGGSWSVPGIDST